MKTEGEAATSRRKTTKGRFLRAGRIARDNGFAVLGLGLYCSLTTFAVQYPSHMPHWVRLATDNLVPLPIVTTASYLLAFLAMALMFAYGNRVPRGVRYIRLVAAATSMGALMVLATYALPSDIAALGVGFALVGTIMTGLGLALLGIEWIRLLASEGPLTTLVCMALSSLLVAGIFLAVGILPPLAVLGCAIAFPWISMACLNYPKSNKVALLRHGAKTRVRVPWKVAFTLFVQGAAAGVMQCMVDKETDLGYLPIQSWALVGAACLALVAVLGLRLDFNQLIYEVGFPLLAMGYVLLATIPDYAVVGVGIHEVGNRFIMMMSWALSAWIILREDLSANWVYPCIMVAYLSGRQLGVLAGSTSGLPADSLAVLLVFVTLMCSVVMFGSRGSRVGWGAFRLADEKHAEGDALAQACRVIARNYGLTSREEEVCLLLVRGRNRSYICEQLTISADTTKSHMRSIYRKLDVHSQQELITLVEAVEQDERPIEGREIPRAFI